MLRREFRIAEGQYMNMGLFRASVFKVNALGYWKLEEEPLEFDFDEEAKRVNVDVKGNEVGRNDIQFGAGYSELDGFFAQAQFNTRNFLGRGNSLGVSLQLGRRTDLYSLSYTEPYFLDRRILLGGSVYKSKINVQQIGFSSYERETSGFTISTGLGVGPFSSVTGILSFQDDYSRFVITRGGGIGEPTAGHQRPVDVPPVDGAVFERAYEVYTGKIHAITPGYNFDSRDDPFDPSRGKAYYGRLRIAGHGHAVTRTIAYGDLRDRRRRILDAQAGAGSLAALGDVEGAHGLDAGDHGSVFAVHDLEVSGLRHLLAVG